MTRSKTRYCFWCRARFPTLNARRQHTLSCAARVSVLEQLLRKDDAPVRGTGAPGVDTDGVLPASSDLHPEDSPPSTTATSGTVDFCTVCGGQHDHRDPQPH